MRQEIDTARLASLIRAKRGGTGLRDIAAQISSEYGNVSPSTLSRLENDYVPDTETLCIICDWLNVPVGEIVIDTAPEIRAVPIDDLDTIAARVAGLLYSCSGFDPGAAALIEGLVGKLAERR